LVNNSINNRKERFLLLIGMTLFIAFLLVQEDACAQSNAPTKLKTEQGGLKRRKFSEKQRKRKSKGTVKRKGRLLEKNYFKNKSSQSNFPGKIWIDPKPKDFTAIKERVERNPSRKNLKASKNRKSYFRASSNQKNKSFGSAYVPRTNNKLSYKYSSKAIMSSKGKRKMSPPKKNYRKTSRKMQNHSGNIFLQPEATKRDYNAIKSRVEKNPGRSMAKQMNRRKNTAIANASLTQTYRGDINVKAQKSKRLTYKFDSNTIQKSGGNLKSRSVKSAEQRRKFNSASAAGFNGDIVLPSRNAKRLRYAYMSKVSQKNGGNMKPAKSPGPQYTSNWRGNITSNDKRGKKQWAKYETKRQTQFSGNLRAKKNQAKYKGGTVGTQSIGGVKVYSPSQQKKYQKYTSGASSNYAGNIRLMSKKSRNQALEGKSLNSSGYEGDIAVLSKKKQDRFMSRNSKISGNYSGNIKSSNPKYKAQEMQGKSLNYSEYRGNIKVKRQNEGDRMQPRINRNMAAFQGNIIVTAKDRKKLEYEYLSAVQHNYKGEVNSKKYSKWLDGRKSRSNTMANFEGNIKVPVRDFKDRQYEYKSKEASNFEGNIKITQRDMKERQYQHMSKSAHNFSGDVVVRSNYAQKRYYKNISDRNQQILGNYRVKTGFAKDIQQQITSARVQNYQGGPKVSFFTRLWLKMFDKSGKLEKIDYKTKKPKYDSREYNIWY
jgi:hypothetical protein